MPLATNALQYGNGVFGGVRGYWNSQEKRIYLLKPCEHFERLVNSAKILGMLPAKSMPYQVLEIVEIVKKLARKNKPQGDVYIRPFIFQSAPLLTPVISPEKGEPVLAMYMIELGDYLSTSKGLKGIVTSWRRIDDAMAPPRGKVCGLYVNSSLARSDAEAQGADEAIFLNQDGSVCEGSAENIFIVRDGKLITPPVCANILEGVTRQSIMEIAKNEGISVIERNVSRTELYIAEEVFLTGTACQVAYFSKIDNRKIGTGRIGPITKRLQEIYFDAVHGRLPEYKTWLTSI